MHPLVGMLLSFFKEPVLYCYIFIVIEELFFSKVFIKFVGTSSPSLNSIQLHAENMHPQYISSMGISVIGICPIIGNHHQVKFQVYYHLANK